MTADLPATLTVAPAPITAARPALVPVFLGQIGGQPAQVCDGRTLHAFLENDRQFADWVKQRIEHYGFQENQDFALVSQKSEIKGRGGDRRSKDYHFGLDMAKEVSMVENNDRGREARRYFISCERLALASGQAVAITAATPPTATLVCSVPRD
jgi:phage anti-repressor protein